MPSAQGRARGGRLARVARRTCGLCRVRAVLRTCGLCRIRARAVSARRAGAPCGASGARFSRQAIRRPVWRVGRTVFSPSDPAPAINAHGLFQCRMSAGKNYAQCNPCTLILMSTRRVARSTMGMVGEAAGRASAGRVVRPSSAQCGQAPADNHPSRGEKRNGRGPLSARRPPRSRDGRPSSAPTGSLTCGLTLALNSLTAFLHARF